VIASVREPLVDGSVLESYNRLSGALLRAVRTLGLDAEMNTGGQAAHDLPNPVCFEVPSAYEITVRGKKLIGSAQARRKAGVLQHGSLPLTGDLARIVEALVFPDDVARREAARRLTARATTAESVLGHPLTWDEAAAAFVNAFATELGLCFQALPISESEAQRASALVQEKYDHPVWTRRV
jgi:lipoate-protein ligase A